MKTKIVLLALIVALTTMGSSCINDNFLVAVNLPIEACFGIAVGGGPWGGNSGPIVLLNLIDQSYRDKLKGARISEIIIKATGPYPTGSVSGNAEYSFDGVMYQQIISFTNIDFATIGAGISVLVPGSGVTLNPAGIQGLVAALNSPGGLPAAIYLRGSGTSSPVLQPGVQLCILILGQVDAEVN